MELCSIGALALMLGVSVVTLRRGHASGHLIPVTRTPGGHRRYDVQQVKQLFNAATTGAPERMTVAYARVSSPDQKQPLETQAERLRQHCEAQEWPRVQVLRDLGSGMNYKKPGLLKLLKLILQGRVERLVLVTKDRLLRFGAELLFQGCRLFNVEVVVLDSDAEVSKEQQLTLDLIEILTVFSSRLYGTRSRKTSKPWRYSLNLL